MYCVEQTVEFAEWLDSLRDRQAQRMIAKRILRLEAGLLGDWKTVGNGVSELRIDYGPGYRLYYTVRGQLVVIMLCGSTKRDQDRAIRLAQELAKQV